MPKILWKDVWIEIRHSLGRFLSILCIVALGVAFFAGIKASAPDMKHSADLYFDSYNTQDIQVFSTLGLTKDDVEEIRKIKGVADVQPLFTIDTLTRLGSSELVYQIFSLPKHADVNQIRLVEGRMPKKENECLIEAPSATNELFGSYEIGDTISLYSGTDEDLSETLKNTEYKVVGTCYTTRYLSYEKGTSSIGSGKINGFMYVPENNIKPDYFTEIDVTVDGAKDINTYNDEYFDVIDPVLKRIKSIAGDQVKIRIQDQQKEVDKAQKKLDKEMEKAWKEIDSAKAEINKGKMEIQSNEKQLNQAKAQLDQGWSEYRKNAAMVDSSLPKVIDGIRQIEEQEQKLPALEAQLKDLKKQRDELIRTRDELEENRPKLEAAAKMIAYLEKLQDTRDELIKKREQVAADVNLRNELATQRDQLSNKMAQIPSIDAEISRLNLLKGQKNATLVQLDINQSAINDLERRKEQGLITENTYNQLMPAYVSEKSRLEAKLAEIEQADALIASLNAQKAQIQSEIGSNPLATLNQLNKQISDIDSKYHGVNPSIILQQIDFAIKEADKHGFPQKEIDKIIEQCHGDPRDVLIQLDEGLAQINENLPKLESGIAQLESGIGQIHNASKKKQELLALQQELLNAYPQLQKAYQELSQGQAEYMNGVQLLEDAKTELRKGEAELKKNEDKLLEEKEKATKKLQEARDKIQSLEGEWIVLDRESFYSYRDYEACADRMSGIASVFPVFFFLVAALVCMTTMTRMVDEQRNEIGTLKALGYSKLQISMKYIMYALVASILGSIIGCVIGMLIFPYIIFSAWNTMYTIESIHFEFQPALMIFASLTVTGITLLATLFSIYKELIEVPSQLMRPKAGKAGKKILLEKIPAIWNRVSFLRKVTMRNIFRYKKRFLMTVIGISGCSALLVSGFGINDSISDIVTKQFMEIYHYDASMTFEKESKRSEKELMEMEEIDSFFKEQTLPVSIHIENKDINGIVHIISDDEADDFSEFTTLRNLHSKKEIEFNDDGLYINEKMAQKMNLKVGDSVSFKDANDTVIKGTVAGIYENYVGHNIYVSESIYNHWSSTAKTNTNYLLKTTDQSEEFESKLGSKLMNIHGAKSVSFYSALQKNFLNMIGSIKMIVVVLVLSAAALAFVVLYNLSNVNISERLREIATIKVLGFTEKEVNQYVNRESLVLAFIGACVGLFVGIGLHHLIMNLAELDDIMFGRTIKPLSYLLSFALTMVFAIIVNFAMKFKLRKIKMVESLKAVE